MNNAVIKEAKNHASFSRPYTHFRALIFTVSSHEVKRMRQGREKKSEEQEAARQVRER